MNFPFYDPPDTATIMCCHIIDDGLKITSMKLCLIRCMKNIPMFSFRPGWNTITGIKGRRTQLRMKAFIRQETGIKLRIEE